MPVLEKLKSAYKLWQEYLRLFPKTSKYSLGNKIDTLFIETIETVAIAAFLSKQEKLPYVRKTIIKLDTLKIFLMIAWETKSLDEKKYVLLSEILAESGRMLGGWHNQLIKQSENKIKTPA